MQATNKYTLNNSNWNWTAGLTQQQNYQKPVHRFTPNQNKGRKSKINEKIRPHDHIMRETPLARYLHNATYTPRRVAHACMPCARSSKAPAGRGADVHHVHVHASTWQGFYVSRFFQECQGTRRSTYVRHYCAPWKRTNPVNRFETQKTGYAQTKLSDIKST